jgi:hypothetical protein
MVRDPASRSWSPARLSGACGPAGAMSAAVRKDLALNLSAVHENIRGRAASRLARCCRRQNRQQCGCFIPPLTARALAQKYNGDLGAADWRHFGRLAGFTNRKGKYKAEGLFPFVRLHQSNGLPYPEAHRFIARIEQQLDHDQQERERRRATAARQEPPGVLRSVENFRANPAYAGDGTRIDLAYAIYALAHGVPDARIEAAIRSRDLTHKGNEKRQVEYVERTMKKAATIVDRGSHAVSR